MPCPLDEGFRVPPVFPITLHECIGAQKSEQELVKHFHGRDERTNVPMDDPGFVSPFLPEYEQVK